MTTSGEDLTRISTCLTILNGITQAFTHLDTMFNELIADTGGASPKDNDRYADHCQLLSDLHGLIVNDLTSLRNDIVCQCRDPEDADEDNPADFQ